MGLGNGERLLLGGCLCIFTASTAFAVDGVNVCLTSVNCFGGIALVVDYLAVNNNLIARLDIIHRRKPLVAWCHNLPGKEGIGGVTLVNHSKVHVTMLGNGRFVGTVVKDFTLYVNRLVRFHVGLQRADKFQNTSHIVWVL